MSSKSIRSGNFSLPNTQSDQRDLATGQARTSQSHQSSQSNALASESPLSGRGSTRQQRRPTPYRAGLDTASAVNNTMVRPQDAPGTHGQRPLAYRAGLDPNSPLYQGGDRAKSMLSGSPTSSSPTSSTTSPTSPSKPAKPPSKKLHSGKVRPMPTILENAASTSTSPTGSSPTGSSAFARSLASRPASYRAGLDPDSAVNKPPAQTLTRPSSGNTMDVASRPVPYRAGLDPTSIVNQPPVQLAQSPTTHQQRPAPYRPGLDTNSPHFQRSGPEPAPVIVREEPKQSRPAKLAQTLAKKINHGLARLKPETNSGAEGAHLAISTALSMAATVATASATPSLSPSLSPVSAKSKD